MVALFKFAGIALVSIATFTYSHPSDPESIKQQLETHRRTATLGSKVLRQCANSLVARQSNEDAIIHRKHTLNTLRRSAGLELLAMPNVVPRSMDDLRKWEASGNRNKTGQVTDADAAWASTPPQCILAPEDIVGPYYYPGELVRIAVDENQPGIPLFLEIQIVDVRNCAPIQGMWVDVWATNATGVYSEIPTNLSGQGGPGTHFQRGAWQTDAQGLASFQMVFPGHYSGRASHVHVMARDNVSQVDSKLAGKAVSGDETQSNVKHIGQLYFDEALKAEVESHDPYTLNKQQLVTNEGDCCAQGQAGSDYDPFPNFVYVNAHDITQGIFAWISIAINPTGSKPQDPFPGGRPWKR